MQNVITIIKTKHGDCSSRLSISQTKISSLTRATIDLVNSQVSHPALSVQEEVADYQHGSGARGCEIASKINTRQYLCECYL